jgi:hypothetical protein
MKSFRPAVLLVASLTAPLLALDPGLLQYATPAATEVAGINLDRAAHSSIASGLISRIGAGDVHEVLLISEGGIGLVAARGTFDRALVAGKLKETYKGVELFAGRRGSDLVAFPEPTVALYGDAKTLKAALDRRGTPTVLDPALSSKIQDVGARYDAWFAAKGVPATRLGRVKLPAESVRFVSGGLTFGDIVRLDAEAVMNTEKDAQSLVQLVKFLTSMADSQRVGQAKELLRNAEAHAEGATVVFSTSASEADIEKLLGGGKKAAAARLQ